MGRNKKAWQKVIAGLFLCSVLIGALILYANILQQEFSKEVVGILREVSSQSVITLNKEIEGEFNLLREIADRIYDERAFEPQAAMKELKEIIKRYTFRRMGIIMPDGTAYTTDNKKMNLKDRDFFKKSIKGKRVLSEKLIDRVDQDEIIVYSMPVYEGEKVCAVLFATYEVKELRQLLAVSAFGGQGYSYVVSKNGDSVINTVSTTGFNDFRNVYISLVNASEENAPAVTYLRSGLESGETGYITFWNKIDKYLYFSPLGINDWYVLNVVPTGFMNSTMNFVMNITYFLCAILIAIFLFLFLYIVKVERQKKQELSDILYVDRITGGYSFARFCVEVQLRLETTETEAAYIMMDIDKFKVINELFGYDEGNRMLQYIWRIWKRCSRRGEIFARRIADCFVVLWYFDNREELNDRIEDFIEELQKNKVQPTVDYNLRTTIGIYIIKDKKEDVQNMMNYATLAHSSIKERGDISYTFYDNNFRNRLLNDKLLEDQFRPALKHKEFIVYYQPKYNADTKQLSGAEALVRWRKQDGTMVMPGDFIPLAEKTGFVSYIDQYIFLEVCRKQKEWLDRGFAIVPVSVNLSRMHLYNDVFMDDYQRVMDETGADPRYVQLELTESAIFENQEALCQIIDRLHAMGFQILMDDFGTGYSSLMMLKSVPIDILKLDKSFVDDFDDPRGEKIITSVIKLAQSLHIEVTAEGVETELQYKFLKELGCNSIQGFYFAKPMPEDEYEQLLGTCSPCGTLAVNSN